VSVRSEPPKHIWTLRHDYKPEAGNAGFGGMRECKALRTSLSIARWPKDIELLVHSQYGMESCESHYLLRETAGSRSRQRRSGSLTWVLSQRAMSSIVDS
jgi:hypothetical protein